MKQQDFETQYAPQWLQLEQWLDSDGAADSEFPRRYRMLCHQLAVAKSRRYGSFLIERLNALVLRCHHRLYGGDARHRAIWLRFFVADFPRVIYGHRYLIAIATLLFLGPAIVMGLWCYFDENIIYSVMSPASVREFESMYDPAARALGRPRQSDTDLMMFGHYIKNNIGISFRTYASGLVYGIGAMVSIVFNGVSIGAVSGFVTRMGFSETFWPFVIGHGAFELTALVLSGAAGLRLGQAIVDPGRHSRAHSLRIAGQETATLMIGVALMLTIAAFLEAFWSSSQSLPIATKLGVGAMLWLLVLMYLFSAGRVIGMKSGMKSGVQGGEENGARSNAHDAIDTTERDRAA
jgi:uncharacterized membrane protein SpoIIM required for sporulation